MYHSPDTRHLGPMTGIFALGVFFIVFLLAIMLGLIYASIAAIVATIVIMALTKLFDWNNEDVDLRDAYSAAFIGLIVYMLITLGVEQLLHGTQMAWRWMDMILKNPEIWEAEKLDWHYTRQLAPGFIATQTPGVICCALVIMAKIRGPYLGVVGFLKACLVSLLAIVISFIAVLFGGLFIIALVNNAGGVEPFITSLGTGLTWLIVNALKLFFYTMVAAIPGGVTLLLLNQLWRKTTSTSYQAGYADAFAVILIYGFTVLILDGIFMGGVMFDRLSQMLSWNHDALSYLRQFILNAGQASYGFFVIHLLALIASVRYLAGGLRRGALPRYAKAMLSSVSILLISFTVTVFAGYKLYSMLLT